MVKDKAAGQRVTVASSDSISAARYRFGLCGCQLLALDFADESVFILAHEGNIPTSRWHLCFRFLPFSSKQDLLGRKWKGETKLLQKELLTQFMEMLIRPSETLEAANQKKPFLGSCKICLLSQVLAICWLLRSHPEYLQLFHSSAVQWIPYSRRDLVSFVPSFCPWPLVSPPLGERRRSGRLSTAPRRLRDPAAPSPGSGESLRLQPRALLRYWGLQFWRRPLLLPF